MIYHEQLFHDDRRRPRGRTRSWRAVATIITLGAACTAAIARGVESPPATPSDPLGKEWAAKVRKKAAAEREFLKSVREPRPRLLDNGNGYVFPNPFAWFVGDEYTDFECYIHEHTGRKVEEYYFEFGGTFGVNGITYAVCEGETVTIVYDHDGSVAYIRVGP